MFQRRSRRGIELLDIFDANISVVNSLDSQQKQLQTLEILQQLATKLFVNSNSSNVQSALNNPSNKCSSSDGNSYGNNNDNSYGDYRDLNNSYHKILHSIIWQSEPLLFTGKELPELDTEALFSLLLKLLLHYELISNIHTYSNSNSHSNSHSHSNSSNESANSNSYKSWEGIHSSSISVTITTMIMKLLLHLSYETVRQLRLLLCPHTRQLRTIYNWDQQFLDVIVNGIIISNPYPSWKRIIKSIFISDLNNTPNFDGADGLVSHLSEVLTSAVDAIGNSYRKSNNNSHSNSHNNSHSNSNSNSNSYNNNSNSNSNSASNNSSVSARYDYIYSDSSSNSFSNSYSNSYSELHRLLNNHTVKKYFLLSQFKFSRFNSWDLLHFAASNSYGNTINSYSGMSTVTITNRSCDASFEEIYNLLLEHGLDSHARDSNGRTALHIACWSLNYSAIKHLLATSAKSSINSYDINDNLPIHLLVRKLSLANWRRYMTEKELSLVFLELLPSIPLETSILWQPMPVDSHYNNSYSSSVTHYTAIPSLFEFSLRFVGATVGAVIVGAAARTAKSQWDIIQIFHTLEYCLLHRLSETFQLIFQQFQFLFDPNVHEHFVGEFTCKYSRRGGRSSHTYGKNSVDSVLDDHHSPLARSVGVFNEPVDNSRRNSAQETVYTQEDVLSELHTLLCCCVVGGNSRETMTVLLEQYWKCCLTVDNTVTNTAPCELLVARGVRYTAFVHLLVLYAANSTDSTDNNSAFDPVEVLFEVLPTEFALTLLLSTEIDRNCLSGVSVNSLTELHEYDNSKSKEELSFFNFQKISASISPLALACLHKKANVVEVVVNYIRNYNRCAVGKYSTDKKKLLPIAHYYYPILFSVLYGCESLLVLFKDLIGVTQFSSIVTTNLYGVSILQTALSHIKYQALAYDLKLELKGARTVANSSTLEDAKDLFNVLSESSLVDSRINKFTRQNLRFHQQYGQLTNNDGVVSCLSLIFDAIEVSNRLDTGSVAVNFDNLSHSITMYDSPSNSQKLAANLRSKLSNVNNQLYTTLLRLKSNASSNAVSNSDSVKITVDLDMDHVYDYIDTTDAIYTEVLQAYQSSNSDWSTITREMQSPSYKTLLRSITNSFKPTRSWIRLSYCLQLLTRHYQNRFNPQTADGAPEALEKLHSDHWQQFLKSTNSDILRETLMILSNPFANNYERNNQVSIVWLSESMSQHLDTVMNDSTLTVVNTYDKRGRDSMFKQANDDYRIDICYEFLTKCVCRVLLDHQSYYRYSILKIPLSNSLNRRLIVSNTKSHSISSNSDQGSGAVATSPYLAADERLSGVELIDILCLYAARNKLFTHLKILQTEHEKTVTSDEVVNSLLFLLDVSYFSGSSLYNSYKSTHALLSNYLLCQRELHMIQPMHIAATANSGALIQVNTLTNVVEMLLKRLHTKVVNNSLNGHGFISYETVRSLVECVMPLCACNMWGSTRLLLEILQQSNYLLYAYDIVGTQSRANSLLYLSRTMHLGATSDAVYESLDRFKRMMYTNATSLHPLISAEDLSTTSSGVSDAQQLLVLTPIHVALRAGNTEIISSFFRTFPNFSVQLRDLGQLCLTSSDAYMIQTIASSLSLYCGSTSLSSDELILMNNRISGSEVKLISGNSFTKSNNNKAFAVGRKINSYLCTFEAFGKTCMTEMDEQLLSEYYPYVVTHKKNQTSILLVDNSTVSLDSFLSSSALQSIAMPSPLLISGANSSGHTLLHEVCKHNDLTTLYNLFNINNKCIRDRYQTNNNYNYLVSKQNALAVKNAWLLNMFAVDIDGRTPFSYLLTHKQYHIASAVLSAINRIVFVGSNAVETIKDLFLLATVRHSLHESRSIVDVAVQKQKVATLERAKSCQNYYAASLTYHIDEKYCAFNSKQMISDLSNLDSNNGEVGRKNGDSNNLLDISFDRCNYLLQLLCFFLRHTELIWHKIQSVDISNHLRLFYLSNSSEKIQLQSIVKVRQIFSVLGLPLSQVALHDTKDSKRSAISTFLTKSNSAVSMFANLSPETLRKTLSSSALQQLKTLVASWYSQRSAIKLSALEMTLLIQHSSVTITELGVYGKDIQSFLHHRHGKKTNEQANGTKPQEDTITKHQLIEILVQELQPEEIFSSNKENISKIREESHQKLGEMKADTFIRVAATTGIDPSLIINTLKLSYLIIEFARCVVRCRSLVSLTHLPHNNVTNDFRINTKQKNNAAVTTELYKSLITHDVFKTFEYISAEQDPIVESYSPNIPHPIDIFQKRHFAADESFNKSTVLSKTVTASKVHNSDKEDNDDNHGVICDRHAIDVQTKLDFLKSHGLFSRISTADAITSTELCHFLKLNANYSIRFNMLRVLIADGLSAIALDSNLLEASEFICRSVRQYPLDTDGDVRKSGNASIESDRGSRDSSSSSSSVNKNKGKRADDGEVVAVQLLQVLQRFRVIDLLESEKYKNSRESATYFHQKLKDFMNMNESYLKGSVANSDINSNSKERNWSIHAVIAAVEFTAKEEREIDLLFHNSNLLANAMSDNVKHTSSARQLSTTKLMIKRKQFSIEAKTSLRNCYRTANALIRSLYCFYSFLLDNRNGSDSIRGLFVYDAHTIVRNAERFNPLVQLAYIDYTTQEVVNSKTTGMYFEESIIKMILAEVDSPRTAIVDSSTPIKWKQSLCDQLLNLAVDPFVADTNGVVPFVRASLLGEDELLESMLHHIGFRADRINHTLPYYYHLVLFTLLRSPTKAPLRATSTINKHRFARAKQYERVIQLLVQHGFPIDPDSHNVISSPRLKWSLTCLDIAVIKQLDETVFLLCSRTESRTDKTSNNNISHVAQDILESRISKVSEEHTLDIYEAPTALANAVQFEAIHFALMNKNIHKGTFLALLDVQSSEKLFAERICSVTDVLLNETFFRTIVLPFAQCCITQLRPVTVLEDHTHKSERESQEQLLNEVVAVIGQLEVALEFYVQACAIKEVSVCNSVRSCVECFRAIASDVITGIKNMTTSITNVEQWLIDILHQHLITAKSFPKINTNIFHVSVVANRKEIFGYLVQTMKESRNYDRLIRRLLLPRKRLADISTIDSASTDSISLSKPSLRKKANDSSLNLSTSRSEALDSIVDNAADLLAYGDHFDYDSILSLLSSALLYDFVPVFEFVHELINHIFGHMNAELLFYQLTNLPSPVAHRLLGSDETLVCVTVVDLAIHLSSNRCLEFLLNSCYKNTKTNTSSATVEGANNSLDADCNSSSNEGLVVYWSSFLRGVEKCTVNERTILMLLRHCISNNFHMDSKAYDSTYGFRSIGEFLTNVGYSCEDHATDSHCEFIAGQTLLSLFCRRGNYDLVQYLLELGASVDLEDEHGFSAIDCSVGSGHKQITKLLSKHYIHCYKEQQKDSEINGNSYGVSPLDRKFKAISIIAIYVKRFLLAKERCKRAYRASKANRVVSTQNGSDNDSTEGNDRDEDESEKNSDNDSNY